MTLTGSEEVAKDQKSVRVRFQRRFSDKPHVVVTAKLSTGLRRLEPEHVSRSSFFVKVNAIPFVRNYALEWEATGEAEHFALGFFRIAAGLGGILALYATMVELRWAPNVLDLWK
ncbi:hypothetical protein U91I_00818 [alpha proteobacterium U9-1i]|nr:hypothetical protein U91I_00818 [alpha proteobacterium U9-1i]